MPPPADGASRMEVFLVPLGPDRHELYCETPDEPETADEPRQGLFRSLSRRFREVLAAAERTRRARSRRRRPRRASLVRRIRDRAMCWIAEAIAEQRLLWHLRKHDEAMLLFPDDLPLERARAILRGALRRDYERHRRWLVIDALALVASGVLMPIPGPNLLAYYFAFRVVGHYLSMRGARQGLDRIRWIERASGPLSELRAALALDRDERDARVRELSGLLQLPQLPLFLDRTALRVA